MNGKPLVSAITIFLDAETFLQEAIESVLAQTYADWELLLVDDGSTDGSTDLALRYASSHPQRIRYLEHEGHRNRGMSASRNLGIGHARGEYVAFLDADDVWLPLKLERQVAILESDPESAMLYGATQYWHSWTGRPEDVERDEVPDVGVRELTPFEPPSLLTRVYPLGPVAAPCLCSLLVRTAIARNVGGFEETFTGFYEDQAFLTKIYAGHRVLASDYCLDRYRIHSASCSATVRDSGKYDAYRAGFLIWLKIYLESRALVDPRVWAALHEASRPYQNVASSDPTGRDWIRLLRVAEGGAARLELDPDNTDLVRIEIERIGTDTSYNIQLNLPRLKVVDKHRYALTFLGRADAPRPIGVGFAQGHAPWANLGLYQRLSLTPEWQSCEHVFLATADEENARVHFDVGESDSSVELSAIALRDVTDGRFVWPATASRRPAVSDLPGSRERYLQLGRVDFGSFRRLTPISEDFGVDRGGPIDRYYIEGFLAARASDVRGRVLEVGESTYTRRYGAERVTSIDVLHVVEGDPQATIIADLAAADHVPSDSFDCIILTQTLQLIYDVRAAVRTIYRILKPGGVLLATFPGITQTYDLEWGATWYWNFTNVSARRLFEDAFPAPNVTVETFGNVLAAVSFLHGVAAEELTTEELDYRDPAYDVTITVRAVKPEPDDDVSSDALPSVTRSARRSSDARGLILMYHRIAEGVADPWCLCVTPENFAQQLEVMRELAEPTPLRQLVGALGDRAVSQRSLVVTFDDGYADNLYEAKPLLERHGVPATIFVTSGYVDSDREFWWDELEALVLERGSLPQNLELRVGGETHRWQLEPAAHYSDTDWERYRSWSATEAPPTVRHALYLALWRLVQPLPETERLSVLNALRAWTGSARPVRRSHRPLSAEELVSLNQGDLVEIGAHTVTHPILANLPLDAQRYELRSSRSELERILGDSIRSFAYPYGAHTTALVPLVRDAGYCCACTTEVGPVRGSVDPFRLPRMEVQNWDGAEFERRLREWLD